MEAKMDTMLEMMTALSLRVLKMEGERKESRVEERIEETVEKKVSEYMEEAKEREKRKLNVIVVNVPECESENAEERQKHDLEALSEMIAKVADVTKEDLGNPVRLGARVIGKKSKPRMMKVTIKSEEAKKKLMTNAHKLNVGVKEPSKRVYFNHDRTEKERADYRKLRAELDERRKEDPSLVIRGGKIVAGKQGGRGTGQNPDEKGEGSSTAQV
jgi:hypothetical protein